MKTYLLFIATSSMMALGMNTPHWTEQFHAEGCGNNSYQARTKAKQVAQKKSTSLKSVCDTEGGIYSVKFQDGYCVEDPENFACRVGCSIIGIAKCN